MLKVGVKIGPQSPKDYVDKICQYADFIEIYGRVNFDYENVEACRKPVVVHAPHFQEGVNLANPEKEKQNLEALEWAHTTADKFGSNKIIFHCDSKENEECSLMQTIKFLKENFAPRIHIENMPISSEGVTHLGNTPEEIKMVMKETGVKFCLDLAHVAEYALLKKINLEKLLEDYFVLSPFHFHLSDADMERVANNQPNAYHKNLLEGDLDLKTLKRFIPKGSWVTLETPQILEKQKKEIEFLKK